MLFVIDNSIPFIQGVFEHYADIVYKRGDQICNEDVLEADALIVRSHTRCDRSLLEGSKLKIIATSSIGMDHIDLPYCSEHCIFVQNASGANAGGVMNYVFSALYGVASRKAIKLDGFTFGIIGVGSSGTRVERMALSLGFKVLKNDPPREMVEGPYDYCSLDYLLAHSNIISLHVPLNDETRGLAGESFFDKIRPGTIFINTSRGEVVVENSLKTAIPKLGAAIIDTWSNEPEVDRELINMVDIATPHIAGYSYQGKQNSTSSVVRTIARFFGISELLDFYPKSEINELEAVKLDVRGKSQGETASLFQYNYPIFTDDFLFRVDPSHFTSIRRDYKYRREFYIE